LISNVLFAQENLSNNLIDVHTSISNGNIVYCWTHPKDDGWSYKGQTGWTVGFGYRRMLTDRFDLETGIDISHYNFESTKDYYFIFKKQYHLTLFSIPCNIWIKMKRHFAFGFGIQYDERIATKDTTTINNQSGIGINVKFEKDFKITETSMITVTPELTVHDIIPFHPEKNQQHLTVLGLRIGYKFGF